MGSRKFLLFADDVTLLASSVGDLTHTLEHFVCNCDAARMRLAPLNLRS